MGRGRARLKETPPSQELFGVTVVCLNSGPGCVGRPARAANAGRLGRRDPQALCSPGATGASPPAATARPAAPPPRTATPRAAARRPAPAPGGATAAPDAPAPGGRRRPPPV